MNKKQLAVVWAMGTILSAIILFVPKIGRYENSYVKLSAMQTSTAAKMAPLTNWSLAISFCIPVLIIGFLLIYTLRSNK